MTNKKAPRYTYPVANEGDVVDQFQCVSFFVPIGWWNKAAIVGAFYQMGFDFMWPNNEYGEYVASRWREAYWLSREDNYMTQVNVTINNEGSSECCCGPSTVPSGQTLPNIPAVITPETNLDQPEIQTTGSFSESGGELSPPSQYVDKYPTWTDFNEQKCRAANFYAEKAYNAIDTIKNIMEATLAETLSAIIGAFVLAVADGPLPAGEALLISILVVPPVLNWFRDSSADRSETVDWLLNLDKCELTQIIYDATSTQNLAQAFGDYLQSELDNTNISDTGKAWMKAYIDFQFRNRFADFVYGNLDNFIPDSFVPECDCVQPPGTPWSMPFTFDSDSQGWQVGAENTMLSAWEQLADDFFVGDSGGALVSRVSNAAIQETGHWFIESLSGEGPVISASSNLTYKAGFGTMNSNGRVVDAIVTFEDGSTAAGLGELINSSNQNLHLVDLSGNGSNVGKRVSRIDIKMKSTLDTNSSPNGYLVLDTVNIS